MNYHWLTCEIDSLLKMCVCECECLKLPLKSVDVSVCMFVVRLVLFINCRAVQSSKLCKLRFLSRSLRLLFIILTVPPFKVSSKIELSFNKCRKKAERNKNKRKQRGLEEVGKKRREELAILSHWRLPLVCVSPTVLHSHIKQSALLQTF